MTLNSKHLHVNFQMFESLKNSFSLEMVLLSFIVLPPCRVAHVFSDPSQEPQRLHNHISAAGPSLNSSQRKYPQRTIGLQLLGAETWTCWAMKAAQKDKAPLKQNVVNHSSLSWRNPHHRLRTKPHSWIMSVTSRTQAKLYGGGSGRLILLG